MARAIIIICIYIYIVLFFLLLLLFLLTVVVLIYFRFQSSTAPSGIVVPAAKLKFPVLVSASGLKASGFAGRHNVRV